MKKRLRKKLCMGEFTEWGVDLAVKLKSSDNFDQFYNDLIDLIDSLDLFCGGEGETDHLSFVIELGQSHDKGLEYIATLTKWLDKRSEVKAHRFSGIFDLCHGDWKTFDAELAKAEEFLKG